MISRLKVAQAVASAVTTGTGKPAGLGTIPQVSGKDATPPYYVITVVGHTIDGPPLADQGDDASTVIQVTAVTTGHDQAQLWADRATTALLGRDAGGAWTQPITVTGAKVTARSLEVDLGEDADPAAAIVSYSLRIRLDLTAATTV